MKIISIIVPVYNEEKTIEKLLGMVKNMEVPLEKEIIVINDGSKDQSLEALKKINGIKLLSHNQNLGKGAAIKTGLANCSGDIIAIQDADLEYNPNQIPDLIKPILENETEIVYGSRLLNKKNKNWEIPTHYIANKALSLLATILYGYKITDVETCYKIFTKNVKNCINLELNDFGFEIEFTAKACKNGFKIKEVPINYTPRPYSEGKKINWRDGVKAFWYLLKFGLS